MFVWAKIRTWDLRSIYMGWFSPYEVGIGLTNSFFKCLKELKEKIYIKMWFILFLAIEEVSYYMSKEGCPTPGCRGVGNAKGYEYPSHDRQIDCPYTPQNLNIDSMKPDRLRSLLLR